MFQCSHVELLTITLCIDWRKNHTIFHIALVFPLTLILVRGVQGCLQTKINLQQKTQFKAYISHHITFFFCELDSGDTHLVKIFLDTSSPGVWHLHLHLGFHLLSFTSKHSSNILWSVFQSFQWCIRILNYLNGCYTKKLYGFFLISFHMTILVSDSGPRDCAHGVYI
jgi:hypothetical protein